MYSYDYITYNYPSKGSPFDEKSKEYGQVNLVKEVFNAAKTANPDAVLLINDFNLSEKYAEVIRDCLEAGVPISAIGLQTHQHPGYLGKEKFLEFIERFTKHPKTTRQISAKCAFLILPCLRFSIIFSGRRI